MKLNEIYKIQSNHRFSLASGNTLSEINTANLTVTRIGYLAAVIGWDHDIDDCADEDSEIYKKISNFAPNRCELNNLWATYEAAGLIATNGPIKMEF